MATKTKERKSTSFSFRVPEEVWTELEWGWQYEGKSQSDFVMDAVMEFLDKMDDIAPELQLPPGFEIPTDESKMRTIRVAPEAIERVHRRAPRVYNSATRLALWACTLRVLQLRAFDRQQNKKS